MPSGNAPVDPFDASRARRPGANARSHVAGTLVGDLHEVNCMLLNHLAEGYKEVLCSYQGTRRATVTDAPGVTSVVTGVPFSAANTVALWGEPAAGALDAVLAPLVTGGLPFQVCVLPQRESSASGAALLRAGLELVSAPPLMIRDLMAPAPAEEAIDGLTLESVEGPAAMAQWLEAFERVYRWPREALDLFRDLQEKDLATGRRWEFYVAKVGDQPVGCSSNFFGTKLAGLYNQGVIPEARRQGIGRALVQHAAQRARERGYRTSMLFASPEGLELYRRCGYREVASAPLFSRNGNGE